MIEASQATSAIRPETSDPSSSTAASRNPLQPAATVPSAVQKTMIAAVTAGPASATFSSVPGESASRSIRAIPPKNQSWMLEIPIPLRIATTAWPNSCSRIEPKKPTALSSASRNGVVPPSSSSPSKKLVIRTMTAKRIRNQDQSTLTLIPRKWKRVISRPPNICPW